MYVKRHVKSKHPELTAIVQDVTAKIIQSDLALKSPCRFCGQTFKNRRAHLSSCIGIFNGRYSLRRLGRKPVTGLQHGRSTGGSEGGGAGRSELDVIRALTPTLQETPLAPATSTGAPAPVPDQAMDASDKSATRARTEDTDDKSKDRQTKWSRPASKGNQQGRGKGQSQNSSKWENWSNWKDYDKDKSDLNQLKQHVDMLTTLVLRQEIFIRTDVTPSLAVTSFNIGQSWKQAKTSNPESLKHPLRVILFQRLLTSMIAALENLLSDTQKTEQAKASGWIQGDHFTGVKWNAEKKMHEVNNKIPPIPIPQTLNLILEATKLCTEPFAINRYHAMRPLASEYSSPGR